MGFSSFYMGLLTTLGMSLDSPLQVLPCSPKFFTFPFQNLQGFISYLKREIRFWPKNSHEIIYQRNFILTTWVKLSTCYWESLPPSFCHEHDLLSFGKCVLYVCVFALLLSWGMTYTQLFLHWTQQMKMGRDFVHLCNALGRSSILVCEYSALLNYLITLILKLLTFINDFFF